MISTRGVALALLRFRSKMPPIKQRDGAPAADGKKQAGKGKGKGWKG
jgi:hypothetical protein